MNKTRSKFALWDKVRSKVLKPQNEIINNKLQSHQWVSKEKDMEPNISLILVQHVEIVQWERDHRYIMVMFERTKTLYSINHKWINHLEIKESQLQSRWTVSHIEEMVGLILQDCLARVVIQLAKFKEYIMNFLSL